MASLAERRWSKMYGMRGKGMTMEFRVSLSWTQDVSAVTTGVRYSTSLLVKNGIFFGGSPNDHRFCLGEKFIFYIDNVQLVTLYTTKVSENLALVLSASVMFPEVVKHVQGITWIFVISYHESESANHGATHIHEYFNNQCLLVELFIVAPL